MNAVALITVAYACCFALPSHAAATCEVSSGPGTAALVELYTSEGCSSCPPADQALRQLRRSSGVDAVVIPLGLHVGYWDHIGWKDVYAQKSFEARQTALAARSKGGFVYTPQFFVNGKELRSWRNALPDAIRQVNARPAQAILTLKSSDGPGDTVVIEASGSGDEANDYSVLYLAISESQLVSNVLRGENSNATLTHDDTVRDWTGPVQLVRGNAQLRRQLRIPPEWKRQHLRAIAFVQDTRTGAVLQAVSSAVCYQGKSP